MTGYSARTRMSKEEAADLLSRLPAETYHLTNSSYYGSKGGDEVVEKVRALSSSTEFRVSVAYSDQTAKVRATPVSKFSTPSRVGVETEFEVESGFPEFRSFLDGRDWK